ncbi:enolase C-terminal domain-like protein [Leifsonia sp. NPDC056824]|uniref:enolase C-terminal domain-like protein n=1 Tax=Leifsonia sp. NPDC056824 TaxID=3345953 RepID=UPI00367C2C74
MRASQPERVRAIRADAFVVPTATEDRKRPESDGTIRWENSSILVVTLETDGATGLGYAYTAPASLRIVQDMLWAVVENADPFDTERLYWEMAQAVRNVGWAGVSAGAIAAVDIALHDLKARLCGMSLTQLLGGAHESVAAYGSGGFTDYTDDELTDQLGSWAAQGFRSVKMKVGSDPADDPRRVALAREVIGPAVELFVDANGAYERKQALRLAELFTDAGVTWFEEPVSSQDRNGLRLLRDRMPAPIRVAAGEYAYTPADFRDLLVDGCVDVLQADATRCGITGFGIAASLASAFGVPLSAHTSPALHASVAAAHRPAINVEYFHDHARLEAQFFDGLPAVRDGRLLPDRSAPGHGLTLRDPDIEAHRVQSFAAQSDH